MTVLSFTHSDDLGPNIVIWLPSLGQSATMWNDIAGSLEHLGSWLVFTPKLDSSRAENLKISDVRAGKLVFSSSIGKELNPSSNKTRISNLRTQPQTGELRLVSCT